jgi:hypothetical protein
MCDAVGVFDHSLFVNHFVGLIPISIWLQKNLAARELAINYFRESKSELLEVIV